jgi:glycosyltransferase involved in cell wall biosynthesis
MVTRGRSALLDACLASLDAQIDAPAWELRVLADRDASVEAVVRERFPSAAFGVFRDARPGGARNFLLGGATGELLLFLDDDVVVEPHLLRHLADLAAANPDVTVFGGPNVTPPRSTGFQTVQGAVLGSLVGAGPVRRRYGRHPLGSADERWFTLCNLAVRRAAMRPFSDVLVCAEENEVLDGLARDGHRMLYDPALVAYHERRPTYVGFAQQMVKYGRGRGQLIVRRPKSLRPAFLVPSGLLAYLALLPALLVAFGPRAALPLALYAAAVLAEGVKVVATLRAPRLLPLAAGLIVTLHLCYGLGVVRGVLGRVRGGPRARADWTAIPGESVDAPVS